MRITADALQTIQWKRLEIVIMRCQDFRVLLCEKLSWKRGQCSRLTDMQIDKKIGGGNKESTIFIPFWGSLPKPASRRRTMVSADTHKHIAHFYRDKHSNILSEQKHDGVPANSDSWLL